MMRTSWRRPLRHSRRCIHTLSASPYLASSHRPSPRASTSWRRLTTLFYSSVIATAAAADVKIKRNNRLQLDQAIANAEKDLDALEPGRSSQLRAEAQGERNRSRNYAIRDVLLPCQKSITEDSLRALGSEVANRLSGRHDNWYPEALSSVSPHSIYAVDSNYDSWRYWTPKKNLTVELAMARLSNIMLGKAIELEPSLEHDSQRVVQEAKMVNEQLLAIKAQSAHDVKTIIPPNLPRYNSSMHTSYTAVQELTNDLQQAFTSYSAGQSSFSSLLLSIHNQLTLSRSPPDVAYLATLINQFTKLRQYDLAGSTIACLFQSHLKKNESTVDAILSHYIAAGQYNRFHKMVQRLSGQHGISVTSTKTFTGIKSKIGPPIKVWQDARGKYHQNIALNLDLYKTIVAGYLEFDQVSHALAMLSIMGRAKLSQDEDVGNIFLRHFAKSKRWEEGTYVWSRIQDMFMPLWLKDPLIRGSSEHTAYKWYLRLCQSCKENKQLERIRAQAYDRGLRKVDLQITTEELESVSRRRSGSLQALDVMNHRTTQHDMDIKRYATQLMAIKIILSSPSLTMLRKYCKDDAINQETVEAVETVADEQVQAGQRLVVPVEQRIPVAPATPRQEEAEEEEEAIRERIPVRSIPFRVRRLPSTWHDESYEESSMSHRYLATA